MQIIKACYPNFVPKYQNHCFVTSNKETAKPSQNYDFTECTYLLN